ncbi:hypothetical protein [Streptomyces sp. NRRL F-4428]|uniref:hypothetical protein n=1 Tax=Streptomyces sp. NRRL F-4428 TaxID=1609137 RepID=UPI00068CAC47|nr:hypothetical protein [Streptomyces sp. NRRL F-4428]
MRDLIIDAVTELKTPQHPYRDDRLDTTKVSIEPVRSTEPRGAHMLDFDRGHGWLPFGHAPQRDGGAVWAVASA